jgi:hypothetical protein
MTCTSNQLSLEHNNSNDIYWIWYVTGKMFTMMVPVSDQMCCVNHMKWRLLSSLVYQQAWYDQAKEYFVCFQAPGKCMLFVWICMFLNYSHLLPLFIPSKNLDGDPRAAPFVCGISSFPGPLRWSSLGGFMWWHFETQLLHFDLPCWWWPGWHRPPRTTIPPYPHTHIPPTLWD